MIKNNLKYNCLQHAVFTFLYAEHEIDWFPCKMQLGARWLHYTPKTEIAKAENGDAWVVIIGFCCDSHGEIANGDIAARILEQLLSGMEHTYLYCDRFAGHYVVICHDGENEAVWGDASCSVQVNYATRNICIGSVDKLVADVIGAQVSALSLDIRKGSSYEQALPGDITMYDGIRALLPNHYLLVGENKAVRVNIDAAVRNGYVGDIINQSSVLIANITKSFTAKYDLVCPLTSGYDSRVVYSFLTKFYPNVECYTFMHRNFTQETADIRIPQQICKDSNRKYSIVNDKNATEDFYQNAVECIGKYHSKHTIDLAYTYLSSFREKALVNGHIIDQVGKSLLGNNVPTWLANDYYFVCKMHNRSKLTKRIIDRYIQEASKDNTNIFDLFALENRCGRWAAQGSMIYSICGITSLNIFNCREVMKLWMQIPRRLRTKKIIHKYCFGNNDLHLFHYPFNPDDKYRVLKEYWLSFYIATFAKQWLQH